MDPQQHYREAEKLLAEARPYRNSRLPVDVKWLYAALVAEAQVHATLANYPFEDD